MMMMMMIDTNWTNIFQNCGVSDKQKGKTSLELISALCFYYFVISLIHFNKLCSNKGRTKRTTTCIIAVRREHKCFLSNSSSSIFVFCSLLTDLNWTAYYIFVKFQHIIPSASRKCQKWILANGVAKRRTSEWQTAFWPANKRQTLSPPPSIHASILSFSHHCPLLRTRCSPVVTPNAEDWPKIRVP